MMGRERLKIWMVGGVFLLLWEAVWFTVGALDLTWHINGHDLVWWLSGLTTAGLAFVITAFVTILGVLINGGSEE